MRLAKNLGLFLLLQLLPFLIILESVAWRLGESVPLAWAARWQKNDPSLVWATYRVDDHARFKLLRIAQEHPDILVMGHSRISQMRASFFSPYRCYVLARVSWSLDHYVELLSRIPPDATPKVIIFSADFFMFSDHYQDNVRLCFSISPWAAHEQALSDVFQEVAKHPSLLLAGGWNGMGRDTFYPGVKEMGLYAVHNSGGFRQDGSEQSPHELITLWDKGAQNLVPNENPTLTADHVGEHEKEAFEEFTALARQRHIALIGIQMPFYEPAAKEIENDPFYIPLVHSFRDLIASGYFAKQGVLFFDLMHYPPYGEDPRSFMDWMHGSEIVSASIVLKLMEDPKVRALLPRLDTEALQTKLDSDREPSQHFFQSTYRESP